MARRNYREFSTPLHDLDAEFVHFQGSLPEATATFAVRYYPWWEHPSVIAAMREGKPWQISGSEGEAQVVTVYATGVIEMKVSTQGTVEALEFVDEHPRLWGFEYPTGLTCNAPLSVEAAFGIVRNAALGLGPAVKTSMLLDYFDMGNVQRYGATPPFSLGRFPRSVLLVLVEEMKRQGFAFAAPFIPEKRKLPALLLIDNDDYIIAEDFEVDVPIFRHRAEGFDRNSR